MRFLLNSERGKNLQSDGPLDESSGLFFGWGGKVEAFSARRLIFFECGIAF